MFPDSKLLSIYCWGNLQVKEENQEKKVAKKEMQVGWTHPLSCNRATSSCQHPFNPALRLDPWVRQERGLCSHRFAAAGNEVACTSSSVMVSVTTGSDLDVESQFISFFSADEISAVIWWNWTTITKQIKLFWVLPNRKPARPCFVCRFEFIGSLSTRW